MYLSSWSFSRGGDMGNYPFPRAIFFFYYFLITDVFSISDRLDNNLHTYVNRSVVSYCMQYSFTAG